MFELLFFLKLVHLSSKLACISSILTATALCLGPVCNVTSEKIIPGNSVNLSLRKSLSSFSFATLRE
ncbi:hypothetical protein Y032_0135g1893 [Ancylostoma ceylanicum]|uniref:Uncharacterized protein n=1 Tax=Ancylostoma ceylanicum TaxID=53326 RepID=A0A016T5E0_9BILA|nr:hypothetical protein Y032_0135g1893 [Ancylostoma ceylanicum]